MLPRFTRRLQNKLIFAFVVVLLIPTGIISFYSLRTAASTLIQKIGAEELRSLVSQANEIEKRLNAVKEDLIFLSLAPPTRRYASVIDGAPDLANATHDAQIALSRTFLDHSENQYVDFRILDLGGEELLHVCGTTYTAIVSVVLIAASLKTFSRNRDWESDTTIFSTDSRHAPGSTRIHYLYGNHFLQTLNQKKVPQDQQENYWNIAVAELKKSIECHADYMESYMGLGDCYARKGMFKEAFDIYNVAIKRKPDFANAHNSLGNCYFKAGQYDNAILALQQAIKIQPDYAEAYNNMGSAYFSKGDYANAVTAFQTAIRISPTYVDAHKNLGSAYGTMKDYDKSIASF